MYVDEVENNTNQREESHNGGQKYLVASGSQLRSGCSTSDVNWTTLRFSAGTGEPVLCAVLFASENLTPEERFQLLKFLTVVLACTNYLDIILGLASYFTDTLM